MLETEIHLFRYFVFCVLQTPLAQHRSCFFIIKIEGSKSKKCSKFITHGVLQQCLYGGAPTVSNPMATRKVLIRTDDNDKHTHQC